MEAVLRLAAALGALVAVFQLLRAVWWLLRGGVDVVVADELARARADRGDLTGLGEARAEARRARRARGRRMLAAAAWLAVVAVPPFTRWTLWLYAAVAAVWIGARVLPRPLRAQPGGQTP
jgi:hypothetical protein